MELSIADHHQVRTLTTDTTKTSQLSTEIGDLNLEIKQDSNTVNIPAQTREELFLKECCELLEASALECQRLLRAPFLRFCQTPEYMHLFKKLGLCDEIVEGSERR